MGRRALACSGTLGFGLAGLGSGLAWVWLASLRISARFRLDSAWLRLDLAGLRLGCGLISAGFGLIWRDFGWI